MTWLCSSPASPTPQGRVTIGVETRPGTTRIVVKGDLDLATLPVLAEQLTLISRDKPDRLVFDLAGTCFMDCGSARLIAGTGQWLPDGQRPVIRHPGPGVLRILELTGLDACFDMEMEGLAVGSIRPWRLARAKQHPGGGR